MIRDERRVKTEKEKARVALRNCGYPELALKEGEQLGKRQKRREENVEGHGENRQEEKAKKAYVVLPYIKGVKEPIRNMTSSSFAKPGTPSGMRLYTLRTQKKNVV